MGVVTLLQHLAVLIHQAGLRAPQGDASDGVGEACAGDRDAGLVQQFGATDIGGEEEIKGRTVCDLRIVLAGGTEAQDHLVTAVFLETCADEFDGLGEVGGDGDVEFVGLCMAGAEKQCQKNC